MAVGTPALSAEGRRVRVYVGEADQWQGRNLVVELLTMLLREGAAGATAFRGVESFGVHGKIHTLRLADVVSPLPIVVEWVDAPERVERLLPRLCEMVAEGLVTVEPVGIVKQSHRALRDVDAHVLVADAMTREVERVRENTPVRELVEMLVGRGFRALPVVDEADRVVGIVTGGDLLERGGLRARIDSMAGLDADGLRRQLDAVGRTSRLAKHVMSAPVHTARPDEPITEATHRMVQRRLKRLAVVDGDGRLVGMLSRADVLRTVGAGVQGVDSGPEAGFAYGRTVGEIARADVPTVGPDAPLPDVLDAVVSTRLLRAVVVDPERRVLGIVSDAELARVVDPAARPTLLQALAARLPFGRHGPEEQARLRGTPTRATDVMLTPVTVPADASVSEAIRAMLDARRKILPVVDADGRLLGAVDRADLLRVVAQGP